MKVLPKKLDLDFVSDVSGQKGGTLDTTMQYAENEGATHCEGKGQEK
jgi:hypothetical protein